MPKVRGNGSVIPLEGGNRCRKWRLQVCVGKGADGGYKARTRQFRGSRREASKALRSFIEEIEAEPDGGSGLTVAQYADEWYSYRAASGNVSPATLMNDRRSVSTIKKHLGAYLLVDVEARDVRRFYAAMMQAGGSAAGNAVSGTSAQKIAVALTMVFKQAVIDKLIPSSPCLGVKLPAIDTEGREALSREDERKLIEALTAGEPDARKLMALALLTCGLRRGEACALRWCDYGAERGSITVRHSFSQARNEDGSIVGLKKPKGKSGATRERTIVMPRTVAGMVAAWKPVQAKRLAALGIEQCGETPMFSSDAGGFMRPSNFYRWWRVLCRDIGLDACPHQLRHTYATELVASGTDMVSAMHLMGHATTDMLARIYAHKVDDNVEAAARAVQSRFFGE